ncbi:MAG TPA: RICIN domain-containing protein [Thermoanaerobaculia bacterium]|nr:RICIN domain-containing protein [Thermoanaerobaculia bacterium]
MIQPFWDVPFERARQENLVMESRRKIHWKRFRLALGSAALALFSIALPAKASCPDTTFTCALGDQFKLGSSWSWSHFQCETNGSVLGAALNSCRNPNCNGVGGRADGCSIPVPGLKQMWNEIFHAACDLHDVCYATIGTTKTRCDQQFLFNMKSICGMPGVGSALYSSCLTSAATMFDAVALAAQSSYDGGQNWARGNCKDPNGPTLPPPPLNRTLRLRSKLGTNKVACIYRADVANGTPTHLWDYLSVPDQEWVIQHAEKDFYTLKAVHSQRCLDLAAGTTADGGKVQQWDCSTGNDNQKWAVEQQADGWIIRSKVSNKCLEVAGSNTANGTTVDQTTCNGGDNQRWYFDYAALPPLGVDVRIRGKQSGKVACVARADSANGAPTHLWDFVNVPDQKWRIEDAGQGYYRLKAQHTQKCLDLANGDSAPGAKVQQWDCTAGYNANQLWRIEKVNDDAWRLRPKASGNCLDAAGFGTTNGTQVYAWPCTWADNQYWYIDTQ